MSSAAAVQARGVQRLLAAIDTVGSLDIYSREEENVGRVLAMAELVVLAGRAAVGEEIDAAEVEEIVAAGMEYEEIDYEAEGDYRL